MVMGVEHAGHDEPSGRVDRLDRGPGATGKIVADGCDFGAFYQDVGNRRHVHVAIVVVNTPAPYHQPVLARVHRDRKIVWLGRGVYVRGESGGTRHVKKKTT